MMDVRLFIFFALVAMAAEAPINLEHVATACIPSSCKLPNCYCSQDGTNIPGNLLPKEVPQMVILTFNGALNVLNADSINFLLNKTRLNPNGCPIRATFFIPHEYTSYYHVEKLYGKGHEIGLQTVTNRQPEDFWTKATADEWMEEVIGMKEILHLFSNISRNDLLGLRAPFLKSGGNDMISMVYNYGLSYDSSLSAPLNDVPVWPYTLDFKIPHKCMASNCPKKSFPGIWEFPLNTYQSDEGTGNSCVIIDQCLFPEDAEAIVDFLLHNFRIHYESNKAPYLLNFHVNWVTDDWKLTALDVFIDYILDNYPDTWFVTMQQALKWLRKPVPTTLVSEFADWTCPVDRKVGCEKPSSCVLRAGQGTHSEVRYMEICGPCPERYPWLDNIKGTIEGIGVNKLYQNTW